VESIESLTPSIARASAAERPRRRLGLAGLEAADLVAVDDEPPGAGKECDRGFTVSSWLRR
jgi:hypothetical protein